MFKNKLGEDSPIPKLIHLKIRDSVESLTTLEEGEFKLPIDGCINNIHFQLDKMTYLVFLKHDYSETLRAWFFLVLK